jgi:hypothetical protein
MTTRTNARQYPLQAVVDLGIANIGTGNGYDFKLPPDAVIHTVRAVIVTAFNSATTTTLTVTDGTLALLSAVDAKAAANTMYSNTAGKFYASGGTITVSMAETGAAATAGRAIAVVEYSILDRSNEVQSA